MNNWTQCIATFLAGDIVRLRGDSSVIFEIFKSIVFYRGVKNDTRNALVKLIHA